MMVGLMEKSKGFGGFIEQLCEFTGKELQFGEHTLTLGEVSFHIDGKEALKVKMEDKKIDINLQGEKSILGNFLNVEVDPEKKSTEAFKQLKDMAEKLKKDEFTVSISYQGDTLLKLGLEAKPSTFLKLITRSSAIEIDMGKLMQLNKDLK